ncbi:phosphohydrolase Icc [Furfurilactobacillus rossiae]|uniref:metallophosphoesterase n=1 Tax=Furfurilactobacillus rossiae TaxID=231049 RepID=UPI0015BBD99A|nr:metallophosphoesterase [Furfurilactobacillus rossiae]MCF6165759.1 metallophosphoesterase [Furfurilactobacillus rossiae]QLE63117.1 phosphohydrolase Icc [Furfurilactobacillus rossiae]
MKLTVAPNDAFRICQLTDLYFGSMLLNPADTRTLNALRHFFSSHTYDLIIVTGDLIWDNETPQESLNAFYDVLNQTNTPVAVTYGNHDTEGPLTRTEIRGFESELQLPVPKTNVSVNSDRENYTLDVYTDDVLRNRLFIWDSGDYLNWNLGKSYAPLEFEQIEWYLKLSQADKRTNRVDLGFLHIPLPEYVDAADFILDGTMGEQTCPSDYKSGLFYEMMRQHDIKGLFAGHDHNNNFRSRLGDIELDYGNVTGYNAYGVAKRGVREIDLYADRFETRVVTFE